MKKPHRIAAGGITFKGDAILLVRYRNDQLGTYLVGPGGALEDNENVVQAIIRETMEETGVTANPKRVVAIEDLMCSNFKMIKIWMVCEYVDGEIQKTAEAEQEKIVDAAWFTQEQTINEIIFPSFIKERNWEELRADVGIVECFPSRTTSF